jgi:hypothetical protein
MRYNGYRYANCRWCSGTGCVYCEAEADKAYKREFPNGPEPIATFKLDNPEDMERMKAMLSPDALRRMMKPNS